MENRGHENYTILYMLPLWSLIYFAFVFSFLGQAMLSATPTVSEEVPATTPTVVSQQKPK